MAGAGKKKYSRSYRRKYKKYYKKYYRRKSKIYKNILGTSTANQCQMCCIVRRTTHVWFEEALHSCYFPIVVNSATAHLRPPFLDYIGGAHQIDTVTSNMQFIIGPQASESYRKALTMFGEQKINGVYISIRPTNASRNYKILASWDRSYLINRGPIVGQKGELMWDYFQKMSLVQGRGPFHFSGDTKYSFRTKCVAKNLQERTTFMDTEQSYSSQSASITEPPPGGSSFIEWNVYGTRALIQNTINPNFAPTCIIPIYREGTDLPAGVEEFEVTVKYYFTFRNPGAVQTDIPTQAKLLLADVMQCTVTDTDTKIKANIGGVEDPSILRNLANYEIDLSIKPEPQTQGLKRLREAAEEEEEIPDEDTLPPDEAPKASYQPTVAEEEETLQRVRKLLRSESVDLQQLKEML